MRYYLNYSLLCIVITDLSEEHLLRTRMRLCFSNPPRTIPVQFLCYSRTIEPRKSRG